MYLQRCLSIMFDRPAVLYTLILKVHIVTKQLQSDWILKRIAQLAQGSLSILKREKNRFCFLVKGMEYRMLLVRAGSWFNLPDLSCVHSVISYPYGENKTLGQVTWATTSSHWITDPLRPSKTLYLSFRNSRGL